MPSALLYAQELFRQHGVLPVAITDTAEAGAKLPLGGTGWNLTPLADRWHLFEQPGCVGVGAQCGPVIHPVHGWCDARIIDVDEKDAGKQTSFVITLLQSLQAAGVVASNNIVWRWGRGPAALVFTRGPHSGREKYGSIQLLGPGKQAVLWGRYRNKLPLPTDRTEYAWPDGDISIKCPPLIPMDVLDRCIIAACQTADIPIATSTAQAKDAEPLTQEQFDSLDGDTLASYRADFQARFNRVQNMPTGSGRGAALYGLGCDYGALRHFSKDWQELIDTAIALLPGSPAAGDQRDLIDGVNDSKGLKQQAQANRSQAVARTYAEWQAQQPVVFLDSTTGLARQQWVVDTLNLSASANRTRKRALTERQMLAMYVPPRFARIEGLLPGAGTVLFAGDAKAGKTYFLHQGCRAMANGVDFVGHKVRQCKVLYITFEEDDGQVKDRIERIRLADTAGDAPASDNMLHDQYDAGMGTLGHDCRGGLLEHIDSRLAEHPGTEVVALDTLYEAFGDIEGGANSNTNGAKIEKRAAQVLTAFAKSRNILIVMPHHTNKSTGGRTHRVGGSIQLQGGVDGVLSMELVEDNPYHMTVKGTVRGLGHIDEEFTREEQATMWSPVRIADPASGSNGSAKPTQADAVFNLLAAANCELCTADIAKRVSLSNPSVVLARLRKENRIQAKLRDNYGIPGAKPRHEGIVIALVQRGIGGADAYDKDIINAIEAAGFADGKDALRKLIALGFCERIKDHPGMVHFVGPAWGHRADASKDFTFQPGGNAAWTAPDVAPVDFGKLKPKLPWE